MEPITRTEKLMAGQQLEPITRKELFLAKAAGMDVETPEPITREEMFLNMMTGGGGGTPGGGGSTASVPWNDVTFIDYDGTVLHSYTLEEAQALTELPPLPEQKGLICQGWNWSLEDIKAQNGKAIVGAMYVTDDGKTRIYITLQEGRTSPMLGVCPNGTVTVDWGDGTEPDVLTGKSVAATTSDVKWTPNHEYAEPGDYVISLSVEGKMLFFGNTTTYQGPAILRCANAGDTRNLAYQNAVKKIEIGNGVSALGEAAFYKLCSLESITIPDGINSLGYFTLGACYSLVSINVPDSVNAIQQVTFATNPRLKTISVPRNLYDMIPMSCFSNDYSLLRIKIPGNVVQIMPSAFKNCHSVCYYDFSACTSVPTLPSTDTFDGIPADCQMLIPSALYDEWSTATNWATYAKYMVAV